MTDVDMVTRMAADLVDVHQHATVDEAVVAALGELTDPKTDAHADMGTYQTAYATLPSILTLIRVVFARHGLAVMQHVYTIDDQLIVETVIRHTSGGEINSGRLSSRMPPNPQQTGSVITYFRRYQLCALVGIAPDVDDDGKAAAAPVQRPTRAPRSQSVPRTAPVVPLTEAQRRHIMAMFNALGLGGDENRVARLAYTCNAIGREITTTNEVERDEGPKLIEALIADTNERHDEPEAGGY